MAEELCTCTCKAICTCRVQYVYPLVGPETPVATPSSDSVETTAESTPTTSDTQSVSGKVRIYTSLKLLHVILCSFCIESSVMGLNSTRGSQFSLKNDCFGRIVLCCFAILLCCCVALPFMYELKPSCLEDLIPCLDSTLLTKVAQ